MTKNRLEAFSDGVIAILITIMVLELKIPHGHEFSDLLPILPVFLSYILSFLFIAIYWNNHHHLLQATNCINGTILWANMNLLFWISLIPFTTGWMGENNFSAMPVALYGIVLLLAGVAYLILTKALVVHEGPNSKLAQAIGKDVKGKLSFAAYFLAIPIAFYLPFLSCGIYLMVALMWIVPDRRIEERTTCE